MSNGTHEISLQIEESGLIVEQKYALAMTAARKILEKHEDLTVAEENRDTRGASKDIARHEIAEGYFVDSVKKFFLFLGAYDEAVENLLALYGELATVGCAKEAKKARADAEKIEGHERYRRDRLFDLIKYVSGVEAMYSEYTENKGKNGNKAAPKLDTEERSSKIIEGSPDGNYAFDSSIIDERENNERVQPTLRAEKKPEHSGAPISVDISKIVEDSVAIALSKFNSLLEKRIESAVADYSGAAKSATLPADVLKMHSELVDFELEIATKLSDLTGKLKGISENIRDIGDAYIQLSAMQSDIADKQRELIDGQTAISADMEKALEMQKKIEEKQTAVSADQSALSECQSELVKLYASIMNTSDSISKSSGEILSAQKEILELQQSAVDSGKKSLELQRALTAKQSELTARQKIALAEHKLVKRNAKK